MSKIGYDIKLFILKN